MGVPGCTGPNRRADQIVVALEAFPTSLDPRFAVDAFSERISALVYGGLTRAGADGGRELYLAASWNHPDPLTHVFELRDGLRFSDGRALTARDVQATYLGVLDPTSKSPKRGGLARVAEVHAEGTHRIVFRLSMPDAAFPEATELGILPADVAGSQRAFPDLPPGAGPYRVVSVEDGASVHLAAVGSFAPTTPVTPELVFRVLADGNTRALELQGGTVDLVQNAIDPDTTAWVQKSTPHLRVISGPYDAFQYLGFNLRTKPLSDRRVRRAILWAIDRHAIVDHVLKGQATVATTLLPPHHWAHRRGLRETHANPARARRLLERAGYVDPDGPGPAPRLTLSFKTTTLELRRRIAEVLADQLARVGISLRVETSDWATFFADVRAGRFQLYSLAWVGIRDPDLFRTILHSDQLPPKGNNRGGWMDPTLDRWLDLARSGAAPKRLELYRRVQGRVARTLPYLPLWWPHQVVVAHRRIEDFQIHPSGSLRGLARARIAEEPQTAPKVSANGL